MKAVEANDTLTLQDANDRQAFEIHEGVVYLVPHALSAEWAFALVEKNLAEKIS